MSRFVVEEFALYLITDRSLFADEDSFFAAVETALRDGVLAVQLREKDLSDSDYLPLAHRMRKLTNSYGAKLLLNSRVNLVKEVLADGVHLGISSISTAEARRNLGPSSIIGYSAHTKEEIDQVAQDVDFITFSPIFETPSKKGMGEPQGLARLAEVCRTSPVPVIALAGIDRENLVDVLNAGASGAAMVRGLVTLNGESSCRKV